MLNSSDFVYLRFTVLAVFWAKLFFWGLINGYLCFVELFKCRRLVSLTSTCRWWRKISYTAGYEVGKSSDHLLHLYWIGSKSPDSTLGQLLFFVRRLLERLYCLFIFIQWRLFPVLFSYPVDWDLGGTRMTINNLWYQKSSFLLYNFCSSFIIYAFCLCWYHLLPGLPSVLGRSKLLLTSLDPSIFFFPMFVPSKMLLRSLVAY